VVVAWVGGRWWALKVGGRSGVAGVEGLQSGKRAHELSHCTHHQNTTRTCTRFPLAAAREYTCFPAASDPTNDTAFMSGWSRMALTTSWVPCTTFNTPLCAWDGGSVDVGGGGGVGLMAQHHGTAFSPPLTHQPAPAPPPTHTHPPPKRAHFGSPACCARSASIIAAPGSLSLGLSTKVLPAVTAMGNSHSGTMAGKLKGQMPAHTPSGCLYE